MPSDAEVKKAILTPAEVEQVKSQLRDTLPSAFSIEERERLRDTFRRLALADFGGALELLRDVLPGANRSELLSLLSDSIGEDAGKLEEFVGDLLASGFPEDWMYVTNILQKSDKSLPIEVVEGWLVKAKSPELTAAISASYASVRLRSMSLPEALGVLADRKFPDKINKQISKYLFHVTANQYPDAAISYAEQVPLDTLPSQFLSTALTTICDRDAGQGAALAIQLAEKHAKPELVGSVVRHWISINPLSTSTWVSDLPPGANKDSAIAQIVEYSASVRDKEAVEKWIESVSDPALKSSLRENYSPGSKVAPSISQGPNR